MELKLFPFEKLDVWKLSKQLVIDIYKITNAFPDSEKYGLRNQLTRAAVSVASNLAEGSARISKKDQAHFSHLAYSSLMETMCQIDIAEALGLIRRDKYDKLRLSISLISVKINALRRSQKQREKDD